MDGFPAFRQAHSDPQIRLAGTNSDCGGLMVGLEGTVDIVENMTKIYLNAGGNGPR